MSLVAGVPVGLSRFRAFACGMTPPVGASVIRKAHTLAVSNVSPDVATQLPPIISAFEQLPRRQRGIYLVWPGTPFFYRDVDTKLAIYNGDTGDYPDQREVLLAALLSGTLDLGAQPDRIYGGADSLTTVERLAVAGAAFRSLTPPEGEDVGVGTVITEGSMEYGYFGLDVALLARQETSYQEAIDAICLRDGFSPLDWESLGAEVDEGHGVGLSDLAPAELTYSMGIMQRAIERCLIDAGWFTVGDLERGDSELVVLNAGLNAVPLAQTTTGWAKFYPRSTFRTPSSYLFQTILNKTTGLIEVDQSVSSLEAQAMEMISALRSPSGTVFGSPAHKLNFDGEQAGGLTTPDQIAASKRVAAAVARGGHSSLVFWSSGGDNDNAEHTAMLGEFDQVLEDALLGASSIGRQPMGVFFDRASYAEFVQRADPVLHVRLGKSTVTNIVGAPSAAYAGAVEHGRPGNIFAEPIAADNVATRFADTANGSGVVTKYLALGTNLGTLGSTFYPSGGPAKTFALRVPFRLNTTGRAVILGNQDANNGLLIWAGSSKSWIADTNMCQVMLKRDGSNYLSIAVNTGGAHADGDWHTLDLHFDHVANVWRLIFDDGVAVTSTGIANDNTSNPWTLAGTLAGFGNFNTNFYAAAAWNGSAAVQAVNNAATDIEISEIIVMCGPATALTGAPGTHLLKSIGRRALEMDGRGVYYPQGVARFYQRAKTQHGALLVLGDSQASQSVDRLALIGGLNVALKETVGVCGSMAAGVPQGNGSYVVAYDGIGRGGIANGSAYSGWPSDLKALIPDTNIVVTDPGTLGADNPSVVNVSAINLPGNAWYVADGATVASDNTSSWIWTVANSYFDSAAELKLYLRVIGSTTGSGSGSMTVTLKNGADVLCSQVISCKGPAPAGGGARVNGTAWEADVAITIPAGTRASAAYTLYAYGSGPCGISRAQIGLASPVGVAPGMFCAEGGRSLRWVLRQLEDIGPARMAATLAAAAQPARMAGQTPSILILLAQGFNDINDANDSVPPDGSFTPRPANKYGGLYQDIESAMRFIDDATALAGLNNTHVAVQLGYLTSGADEWYVHHTYAAALQVAKARAALTNTTTVPLSVFVMGEFLRHSEMQAGGAFAADTVHATRSGFIEQLRVLVNGSLDATSQYVGEQTSTIGVATRQLMPLFVAKR